MRRSDYRKRLKVYNDLIKIFSENSPIQNVPVSKLYNNRYNNGFMPADTMGQWMPYAMDYAGGQLKSIGNDLDSYEQYKRDHTTQPTSSSQQTPQNVNPSRDTAEETQMVSQKAVPPAKAKSWWDRHPKFTAALKKIAVWLLKVAKFALFKVLPIVLKIAAYTNFAYLVSSILRWALIQFNKKCPIMAKIADKIKDKHPYMAMIIRNFIPICIKIWSFWDLFNGLFRGRPPVISGYLRSNIGGINGFLQQVASTGKYAKQVMAINKFLFGSVEGLRLNSAGVFQIVGDTSGSSIIAKVVQQYFNVAHFVMGVKHIQPDENSKPIVDNAKQMIDYAKNSNSSVADLINKPSAVLEKEIADCTAKLNDESDTYFYLQKRIKDIKAIMETQNRLKDVEASIRKGTAVLSDEGMKTFTDTCKTFGISVDRALLADANDKFRKINFQYNYSCTRMMGMGLFQAIVLPYIKISINRVLLNLTEGKLDFDNPETITNIRNDVSTEVAKGFGPKMDASMAKLEQKGIVRRGGSSSNTAQQTLANQKPSNMINMQSQTAGNQNINNNSPSLVVNYSNMPVNNG